MAHKLSGILSLIFLVVSLHVDVIAEVNEHNIIQLGSSLYAGKKPSSWPSSSGHFEFGFYPQGSGYAVGIWLVGEPENTIVWTANRDDPPVSSNATLEFTEQCGLQLRTEDGMRNITEIVQYFAYPFVRSIYKRGKIYSLKPIDSASMLDTGNFVIYQNKSVVYSSFDSPTDTILEGQNLSSGGELISSVSRSNHSTGQYFLSMQTDGNLVAYVNNSAGRADITDAYWSTKTYDPSSSVLNLNKKGVLTYYSESYGEMVLANVSSTGNNYRTVIIYRATLDPDGIFRMYAHQLKGKKALSGSTSTIMMWQNLDDKCDVAGVCGLNSYCSSRGNDVGCYCYPGFTFINENKTSLGCSQDFTIDGCETREDVVIHFNFTTFQNMTWSDDPYSLKYDMEKEDCKKACEKDCYCGGVLYSSGEDECRVYSLPFKYGRRSASINTTAFIKLNRSTTTNSPAPQSDSRPIVINEGNHSLISIMGLSLGSVACLSFMIAICSFLIYKHRVKSYAKLFEKENSVFAEQFTLRSFSLNELDGATNGFQDELGRGSFGVVYKGTLPGDGKPIAVKRLEVVNEGERDLFRAEMTAIGRTNHRNLVRLLGFCVEGSRKLLVYEYLSNGSLADFLFSMNKLPVWKERARIALDVAKGILYLHEECEMCIIHCNIKPHNILLDDSMTAKISDFGLAKLLRPSQTSNATGTAWYSAPEWQNNASVSVKVDVYSFGVILLEIICCRSNIELEVGSADEILLSTWVYNCFVGGELNKLVEVKEEEVEMKMVERFVKVGLWCIQDDPNLRPLMKNVILMLEGTMNVPIPPSPSVVPIICY